MSKSKKVTVVGAGLVGSLLAVLLARRGYEVHVFERRSDMRVKGYLGGRSINLAMSFRGWHAIEKAGLAEKLRHTALPMPGRMMHSVDGVLTFQPYGKADQAIFSVSRGGLNLELLRCAGQFPNVHFNFEHRCLDVDLQQPVITFLDEKTGKKRRHRSDVIFGTDGAFSAVRYAMQRTDRFDYAQKYLEHGYKELTIPPDEKGNFRIDPKALHIWPRGNFMMIALPNADGSFTCTLFLPFEGEVSFQHLTSDEAVLQFFKKYFADAVPLMPTLLEDFWKNPTSSLVTVQCRPWQWQQRMVLLGDAAHAIVPFYGQGMNAGFEDCTILDGLHDEFSGDWSKIIPAFAERQEKNGHAIAELALRNFVEMRDKVADPRFLLRKKIAAHLHEKYPAFLPVYSMVSFSNTPYHLALRAEEAQEVLFSKILALPNIENHFDSPAVDAIFNNWWQEMGANLVAMSAD